VSEQSRLAVRLRELRGRAWDGVQVTQKNVADALGISVALVSSWESGAAVPPEERLQRYARFFATRRSLNGEVGVLLPAEDLTAEEDARRQVLIEELVRLREEALQPGWRLARQTGALGGRFWYFPDGQTITIVGSALSDRQVTSAYTRKTHPNYIHSLGNGDMDSLIELVGHIRAENPGSEVRWLSVADITDSDQLTGHLVMLGSGDFRYSAAGISTMEWFIRRLDLPVHTRLPDGGDEEYDQEIVVVTDDNGIPQFEGSQEEVYRPRFLRDENDPKRPRLLVDGFPLLEYDVGILARQPNALNLSATFTWCCGIFSRGTYGVVRALTDANLRARNEHYITEHFPDLNQFWMVLQVPVFAGETITPDLARPFLRLRSSA
jgi:transcriptional regulator with XRE-family HTH domain